MTQKNKSAIHQMLILGVALLILLTSLTGAGSGLAAPIAQAASPTAQQFGIIEYVVDLSASMKRPLPDGDTIWDKTLNSIFTYEDYFLNANLALGLRTFGYPDLRCDQQAQPSSPVVAPRLGSGPQIVEAMGEIVPNPSGESGRSAILAAISKALEDIGGIGRVAGESRSIIVFTDGLENCMLTEQERQAWADGYAAQVRSLAENGIRVKTYVLIIVPVGENICTHFTGHEDSIVCIPVSAVEASNLPGIVESIRVETVFEDTPTPTVTLKPSDTSAPTFTPTPTDYVFHEVPTGEALPTIDRTLIAQAGTPVLEPQSESSGLDPKILAVPVALLVLIGLGMVVAISLNLGGVFKKGKKSG